MPKAESRSTSSTLRHADDSRPGITRVRRGPSFRYRDPRGKPLTDQETLARIRKLAIPPAWTDVWICGDPQGHLQAVGRDEKGRKQYRYHEEWTKRRDRTKYERMIEFGQALGPLRRRVDRDLTRPGLDRRKVLALVVRLLETTLIRIGNDEYARSNRSFGLTTLRDRHATVERSVIRFRFRGKSKVDHDVDVKDPRLAKLVRACRDLPGQDLFQYRGEDGQVHDVGSADVNEYLREATGGEFTAKDFRTWAGTVLATLALREFETFDGEAEAKRNVVRAVESVAARLGNTPSVCRKCYIHPAVIDAYLEGTMLDALKRRADQVLKRDLSRLRPEEAAVLALLRHRLEREKDRSKTRRRTA